MNAADVLDDAAVHVENGWCRRKFSDSDGRVCAMGALQRADPLCQFLSAALDGLVKVLRDQYGVGRDDACGRLDVVTYVNDWLCLSAEDMAACMRKAAVDVRGKL